MGYRPVYGFGGYGRRPYYGGSGWSIGAPFLGGLVGGLIGSAILRPRPYPFYGGAIPPAPGLGAYPGYGAYGGYGAGLGGYGVGPGGYY
ncbi:hypothetical protein [Peribacillus deserti]|uniref:hypothetical protein n=1 Tax=Peribacillus deserti TaxID=673318 RepID=UPI002152F071|nr:hypothetical protein [Peribacillus deserti]